jgi:hypothetical protein
MPYNAQRKPAFHVAEPNRLIGNKVQLTLDPLMARALCDKIESLELDPDEEYLYAMVKHIRRYYAKLRLQAEERDRVQRLSQENHPSS